MINVPKYKNTKEFVQPIMVNGKRQIVRPGQVVELPADFNVEFASFLEKVSDDVPITKPGNQKVIENIENIKKSLDDNTKHNTIEQRLKSIEETQEKILKRLDILKNAVGTMDQALRNIEETVYNKEDFVIDEEEKKDDTN